MNNFLVTGCAGFIGSHAVDLLLSHRHKVCGVDKLTYAGNINNLNTSIDNDNFNFYQADICDRNYIQDLLKRHKIQCIINFAAESHVDNSITNCAPFIESNVIGVHNLLELIRTKPKYKRPSFFHISTDEVYGDIMEGAFKETDKLNPSNPYSATKACSEMLINSYHRTYGLRYVISRSGNNYGSRQYEEKLVAKAVSCLKDGAKIPLHGDGSYNRDWTHVKDNIDGIMSIIDKGIVDECFNIAANNHFTNKEVALAVIKKFNKTEKEIEYVEDRWGQDIRYSVDTSKIKQATGWKPQRVGGLNLDFVDEELQGRI